MQRDTDAMPPVGCTYLGEGRARFLVWAPGRERVQVRLLAPQNRLVGLRRDERGYFDAVVDDVQPGTRYLYRLDDEIERPDPASKLQPEGVHGPSAVVAPSFAAVAASVPGSWQGIALDEYIIYELHIGSFTGAGTFEAAIERLDTLVDLGVTAVEVMPIADFPGARNWGYDGVYPFAVHTAYGGPKGFSAFVDACHARGLAVVLDVVYNHLGPEGNYLRDFAPYFSNKYRTPWGDAINFDERGSDEVRRFFLQNARQWIAEFGVDALRLDAVHAIFDDTPVTFLEDLGELVDELRSSLDRRIHLFAETHANDPRLITPTERGGLGMDCHWADDFHHAVHTLLTGEDDRYYVDYGTAEHLAHCLRDGYTYTGEYSEFHGRRHGKRPAGVAGERFLVCLQNHDQVGNRAHGRRLAELCTFEQQKLAATTLLCSPFVPLLFMGEAYGERARFPYFISHGDVDLVEAVRRGRQREFAADDPACEPLPDPADRKVFEQAKLDHDSGNTLWKLYTELISLRKNSPALAHLDLDNLEVKVAPDTRALVCRRWYGGHQTLILLNFDQRPAALEVDLAEASWQKRLETSASRWQGPGARLPDAFATEAGEAVRLEIDAHAAALFDAYSAVED